ncbi:MAG TPA: VOC family protein [Gemmatimonadaceae bacterium]|jgi:catechol 2,3-dioxygenase-like lactoylglutathione lyase family enzyme
MLGSADLIAFVPTRDPVKARQFYENTLGLEFISADRFALVFNAHGTSLRVADVSEIEGFRPAPFTIVGWKVTSASDSVGDLVKKGVRFERFPGMDQDAAGIWESPSGARVAWFKDPDGNILSITQV